MEDFPNAVAPSITRLQLFGLGESGLQQSISDDFPDWPANVEVSNKPKAKRMTIILLPMVF